MIKNIGGHPEPDEQVCEMKISKLLISILNWILEIVSEICP